MRPTETETRDRSASDHPSVPPRKTQPIADGGHRPGGAPSLWPTIGFLRRLREGMEGTGDLPGALAGATVALPRDVRENVAQLVRRLGGDYPEDEWGFDEQFAETALPFLEFLYKRWWRVKVTGVRNVPSHGRALLVSNHAGSLFPWDGAMIGTGILEEHPLPRFTRFLVLNWAFELPFVVLGDPQDGRRAGIAVQRDPAARAGRAGRRLPRGREGHGQGLRRPLPAAALRPRRVRGDGVADPLADRAGGRGGQRGDLPEARRGAAAGQARGRPVLPRHADVPAARARSG